MMDKGYCHSPATFCQSRASFQTPDLGWSDQPVIGLAAYVYSQYLRCALRLAKRAPNFMKVFDPSLACCVEGDHRIRGREVAAQRGHLR
jgi:hypothetical protein